MSRGSGGRSGRGRGKGRTQTQRSARGRTMMTRDRARAIQAHTDKSGRNQDFKGRAMSAAERNEA